MCQSLTPPSPPPAPPELGVLYEPSRVRSLLWSSPISLSLAASLLATPATVQVMRQPRTVTVALEGDFAPPPPPPGPGGAAPAETPRAENPAPSLNQEAVPELTPHTLPTEPIPVPEPALTASSLPQGEGIPGGAPVGVPGGVPGGVAGGKVGGVLGGKVGGIVPPRFDAAYLKNPAPEYPSLSRRMGEIGQVVLRVLVTPQGVADRMEIKNSSGYARLDQAALEAVRKWRFIPARQGEEPLSAWVIVPITFNLDA